jgi:hypothetical protein
MKKRHKNYIRIAVVVLILDIFAAIVLASYILVATYKYLN